MKKSLLLKVVVIALVLASSFNAAIAQVTTSAMVGLIKDAKGPLPGANVKATHTPSGTVYNISTNTNGRFAINNMRVGGPYTLDISYVGFTSQKLTDVFLKLGDTYVLDYQLNDGSTTLNVVTIKGTGVKGVQQKTGASTNISSRDLVSLPTISRSINDFTRLTPQANGNSFGGRDARYNNIQVDGANLNNNFGLSNDPLPGGGSQPISLDSYEQISVNIAPYDVRQAGFTGANISAVTKSGTNTFHGSAYGLYRDQSFLGTNVAGTDISNTIADSESQTYGFTLGGPIIKNKLFFFVNAEKETNLAPGIPFFPTGGTGSGIVSSTRLSDLKLVSDNLRNRFGYETGAYDNFPGFGRDNHKILAKIDWNINNNHKLTVKYSDFRGTDDQTLNGTSVPNGGGFRVTGQTNPITRLPQNRFGVRSASFENSNYGFLNTTRTGTLELNSKLNNNLSNQLLLAFTNNRSTRDFKGGVFPTIDIFDGAGNNFITAGMDPFTLNNDVVNNVYSFTNNLTYTAGKHNLTAGLTYEYQKVGNMFMAPANSYYAFNSLNDFLTDQAPVYYAHTFSVIPNTPAVYSAELKIGQLGAYVQDEVNITDNFKLTLGLRADMPIYHENPLNNPATSIVNFLSDDNATLRNYRTDKWARSMPLLSPRMGFRATSNDKQTTLRGGLGIFTGRIPFVFLTNIPTNTGMYQIGANVNNSTAAGTTTLSGIRLNPNPATYAGLFPSTAGTRPNANVVFIDEDFRFPKVFRANLGLDKNLGNGYMFTFDGLFTKDINAVRMRNANLPNPNGVVLEGDQSRPRIVGPTNANRLNPGITSAIVLENTNKGYSTSLTAQLSKSYNNGFYGSVAYTFSAAKDVTANPGSQALSVWNSNPNFATSNFQEMGNSAFAIPHRVIANLSYRKEYFKHLGTTVSLFFEGSNQGLISYVYNGDINGDGNNTTDLMYIPRRGETPFQEYSVGSGATLVTFTAADQEAALNQFIENSPYLRKNRGRFAERNAALLPWVNRVDFRFLQDVFINTGKNNTKQTLQFSVDIMNASNLINNNWGVRQRAIVNNPLAPQAVNAVTNRAPYRLQNIGGRLVTTPFQDVVSVASTYSVQVGLRYIF